MTRRLLIPILIAIAGGAAAAVPSARPGATDAEAERQAPPAPWRRSGWRAVFPHAYALRRRVAVRPRPDAAAPTSFQLIGGMRVPVYEQRAGWWRVGGSKGRSGWVREGDVAPHARCVVLDAQTGRVLRSFATKGQWSVLPRMADELWALADTGVTRIAWDGQPRFWSKPLVTGADHSIRGEAVWSADLRQLALPNPGDERRYDVVSLTDGGSRSERVEGSGYLERHWRIPHVLLLSESPPANRSAILDPFSGREAPPAPGHVEAVLPGGDTLSERSDVLELRDRSGAVRASAKLGRLFSVVAAPDGSYVVATRTNGRGRMGPVVLQARTLKPVVTLREPAGMAYSAPEALLKTRSGWLTVQGPPDGDDRRMVWWSSRGGIVARGYVGAWAIDPRNNILFVSDQHGGVRRIDPHTGASRTFPARWRHPLNTRHLGAVGSHLHWEISFLTSTADGKRLVALERLAGDEEG